MTDEYTFFKMQSFWFWCDSNPHIFRLSKIQSIQENVWVGILGENIIGPLFCGENLTGDAYLETLKGIIDPLTTQIISESEYDDCPVHLKK